MFVPVLGVTVTTGEVLSTEFLYHCEQGLPHNQWLRCGETAAGLWPLRSHSGPSTSVNSICQRSSFCSLRFIMKLTILVLSHLFTPPIKFYILNTLINDDICISTYLTINNVNIVMCVH